MRNTFFNHKDGSLSSYRGTMGGMSFTSYKGDSSAGGVTTRMGNFISRFNKTGQCIGTGIRMPRVGTAFFSKSGMPTYRLTPFK